VDNSGDRRQIDAREDEEVGRIEAEYQPSREARGSRRRVADRAGRNRQQDVAGRDEDRGGSEAGESSGEAWLRRSPERDERIPSRRRAKTTAKTWPVVGRVNLTLRPTGRAAQTTPFVGLDEIERTVLT